MGTFESLRRAYGALKDSTTVGLAKVSSDFKDLDIAIVKATNHDECPPKEQHVRRIIVGTSFGVPRADVGYCIHALSRRLTKTKNWIVAVKILMVFHRILREGDPSFREEFLNYSHNIFQIQEFRDESSQLAWDCSSWVRMYAIFLEERLECYRVLRFDIETETIGKEYSRTRLMNVKELLEKLPTMQQLLYRLIACLPEGAAYHNCLIQHAFALVLRESLKIYCVINDGIIKLLESFFNLSKDDAVPALNIYKRAGKQAEKLAELFNLGKHLRLAMNIQFPTLTQPPPSFLATMEEYVKGASSNDSVSYKKLEHQNIIVEELSPQETKEPGTREIEEVEKKEVLQDQEPEPKPQPKVEVLPLIDIDDDDPPDPNETNAKAAELEDSNASRSTLAIVQPCTTMSSGWNETEKTSSWELAIVSTPSNSNNTNTTLQANPGGGFDKLLPYSLYEDDIARNQIQPQHTGFNLGCEYGMQNSLFQRDSPPQQDPFMTSGGVVSPNTMSMVMRQHQQQYMVNQHQYQQHYQNQYHQWYQQQQNMFMSYNHQQSSNQYAQRPMCIPKPNSFGDAINHQHGNRGLI